eukprot:gene30110-52202_t
MYAKDSEVPYQVQQAKIAISNGGMLLGLGPGNSQQRNFLPQAYNDFIYSIIIEEYGLLGGAFMIFIYLVFLFRCISIFRRCPYAFGAFLALGLSFTLVIQAVANMAVNVNLVPVTGVTLPLVSMGGSSFLFTCAAIGIVLSVARNVEQLEGKAPLETGVNPVEAAPAAATANPFSSPENLPGGGTGGHIFPAVAIANAIKYKVPTAEILFIGAVGKMEMEKVPQAGYEIKGLDIAGFN